MDSKTRTAFGLLVLSQAVHSIEEYLYRLYDVFGLTRFVSGLFSRDLATGFAIANVGIIAFGLWCYLVPVRHGRPMGRAIAWGWVVVELANGVVHVLLAVAKGGYFPGLGTAPLLFASSVYLASRLVSRPTPLTPPAGGA
jgi:hypothetical protein